MATVPRATAVRMEIRIRVHDGASESTPPREVARSTVRRKCQRSLADGRPPGTPDHEPQHERDLSEKCRLTVSKHRRLVLWHQLARQAQGQIGNAAEGEPHGKKAR